MKDRAGKLFVRASLGEAALLRWDCCDESEAVSRGELFRNIFTAFRNSRAHGEQEDCAADQLSEFLLVNQLFRLDRAAIDAAAEDPGTRKKPPGKPRV